MSPARRAFSSALDRHLEDAAEGLSTAGQDLLRSLLADQRFSTEVREQWEREGRDVGMACAEPGPEIAELCASIARDPFRGALVRLVSESQGVLDQRVFERELADLAPANLYGPGWLLLSVTVDYSIGWGSYAGPATLFVEPSGSKLRWLAAHDATTGKSEEMTVSRALKSAWQTTPRRGGRDILAIRCRPDHEHASPDGELAFVVIYERDHFDGSRWLLTRRTEPGFWEYEGEFPPEKLFP